MMHTSLRLAFKIWYCLVLVTQKNVIVPQMFYRAYHWQNICAWQVLSCTECFKGTFIFVSLKDLKKGLFGADGQVGLWSRGASNWICGATSLFLLLPSKRHRNKQRILFWPSTTPLLRRDQFGGKEHSFHNFSAIIAKKSTKKHDFLFELHRVHWGVG